MDAHVVAIVEEIDILMSELTRLRAGAEIYIDGIDKPADAEVLWEVHKTMTERARRLLNADGGREPADIGSVLEALLLSYAERAGADQD